MCWWTSKPPYYTPLLLLNPPNKMCAWISQAPPRLQPPAFTSPNRGRSTKSSVRDPAVLPATSSEEPVRSSQLPRAVGDTTH